jgi:hypothetical protein
MSSSFLFPVSRAGHFTTQVRKDFMNLDGTANFSLCKQFCAPLSEAPRASARGIYGKAKRNYTEATRLRPAGYAAVAFRHSSPCFRTGHPGEGE